jgi:hypothetical protein
MREALATPPQLAPPSRRSLTSVSACANALAKRTACSPTTLGKWRSHTCELTVACTVRYSAVSHLSSGAVGSSAFCTNASAPLRLASAG